MVAARTTTESFTTEQRYQRLKSDLHLEMVGMIDVSKLGQWKAERLQNELRVVALHLLRERQQNLSDTDRERLLQDLHAEMFGLGPLEGLMDDPTISDILVNGPSQIYVERHGRLEPTDLIFADDAHLMQIIQRIAAASAAASTRLSPMVDARLPDGSRVNAIIPPLALDGPVLSIRRFGVRLDRRRSAGQTARCRRRCSTCSQAAVEARISVLISGGTGSGKTTLLNTLSRYIPADERLVTIEDSAELKLQQPHVVRLETRPRQPRRRRRGQAARPGPQRPAHAAGPHHHRRGAAAPRRWTCCRR